MLFDPFVTGNANESLNPNCILPLLEDTAKVWLRIS